MKLALMLFVGGMLAHVGMYYFIRLGGPIRDVWTGLTLLDNRGETEAPPAKVAVDAGKPVLLTQEQVDHVVQERLARERQKFADYETLKQKNAEYEKLNSEKAQKDLEAGKQYEEAKKGYEGKIKTYEEKLAEKDRTLSDMAIGTALTNAINAQNGYPEEALALLRSSAKIVEGLVKITMKDANGVDQILPVEEGVKRFLTARPHLVKANARGGSGTGSGTGNGSELGGGKSEDLNSLNAQYNDAMNARDLKKASEIRTKIKTALAGKGVNI